MPTTMRGTITTADLNPVEVVPDDHVRDAPEPVVVVAPETPPKKRARRQPAAKRTRVIEIDEEIHEHRDIIAIRLAAGETPYSIWDCPTSPAEKIRINTSEVLRFRNGNLECRDETDDAMVEHANTFAGGKYLRADPDRVDDPFTYVDGRGRTTRWHSKKAFERYVALHPRES